MQSLYLASPQNLVNVNEWKIIFNPSCDNKARVDVLLGLRARMGAGYSMMNDLTIIQATQVRFMMA